MIVAIRPASPKVRIRSEAGKLQRDEGEAGGRVRQHAGRTDDQDGVANGLELVFARDQPVAYREGELHAVGKAYHHDQRRHHVEEHVEPEIEPAEKAKRQQNGEERRRGRNHHEGHAPEEENRNHAAGEEADSVVDQPVALHGVADLELHHRHAGKLGVEPGSGEILFHRLADLADDVVQALALHDAADRARARSAPARRPPTGACRG